MPGSGSSSSASASSNGTSTSASTSAAPAAGGSYRQAGDSYWRIANKYRDLFQRLQRLNGTSNYFLCPGQALKCQAQVQQMRLLSGSNTASTTSAPAETANPSAPSTGGGNIQLQTVAATGVCCASTEFQFQNSNLNGTSNYFLYPGQVSGRRWWHAAERKHQLQSLHQLMPLRGLADLNEVAGSYTVKQVTPCTPSLRRNGVDVYKLIANNGEAPLHPSKVRIISLN